MASVGGDSGDVVSLNIMPMLDVFSILILFLLMNFSSDPMSHDVNQAIELPYSMTLESLDEVPTVIVTKKEIFVNDKSLVTLVNGKVDPKFKHQGAILPLYQELVKMSEANRLFTKEKTNAAILTIEVDKDHKFELLKSVIKSAQQADFITFKLTVSKQI